MRPGVAKPKSWSLQPWKKAGKKTEEQPDREKLLGAVYATAIAKYVIKRGRVTVPPEQALLDADMVPKKPEGWVYEEESESNDDIEKDVDGILPNPVDSEVPWNWSIIEAERLRGLKIAQKFAEMDGMHEFFDGGKDGVLGEFADLLF